MCGVEDATPPGRAGERFRRRRFACITRGRRLMRIAWPPREGHLAPRRSRLKRDARRAPPDFDAMMQALISHYLLAPEEEAFHFSPFLAASGRQAGRTKRTQKGQPTKGCCLGTLL